MKLNYETSAATFDKDYTDFIPTLTEGNMRLVHACLGLSGETGELVDIIKKSVMYGKPLDIEHVKEEMGDCMWYMALILKQVGSSFDEVMQLNINKLSRRYPNGYSNEAAIKRADKVG